MRKKVPSLSSLFFSFLLIKDEKSLKLNFLNIDTVITIGSTKYTIKCKLTAPFRFSVLSNITIVSCLIILFCLKGIVLFDYIIGLLLRLANLNLKKRPISMSDVCIYSINKVTNFNMATTTSEKVISSLNLLIQNTISTPSNNVSATVLTLLCISSFTMSINQSISPTILASLTSEIHSNMANNQPPTLNLSHIFMSLIYIVIQVFGGCVLGFLIRNFVEQIYPIVNKQSKTGNICYISF